jgi:hypothetical protein
MGFLGFFRKKEQAEPNKEKVKTLELDKEHDQFSSIERFNTDRYVERMFLDLFHAVRSEEWRRSISYGTMEFKKDNVTMKLEFSDHSSFKIKSVSVEAGYKSFRFRSEMPIADYAFFHEVYCKNVKEENEDLKKRADEGMAAIREAIGKTALRDGKIDFLLGED